jgi:hypothetical protein
MAKAPIVIKSLARSQTEEAIMFSRHFESIEGAWPARTSRAPRSRAPREAAERAAEGVAAGGIVFPNSNPQGRRFPFLELPRPMDATRGLVRPHIWL